MNRRKNILLTSVITIVLVLSMALSGCSFFNRGDINDFADELFPMLFSSDALSANFYFENADEYLGLTPTASISTPSSYDDYVTAYESYKTQAAMMAIQYKYSKMSDEDQELFRFLQDFFIDNSAYADYYYLQDSYIGGYSGLQASLPIYFTEYKFNDKQDIEDYIYLLQDTATAFPKWVDYEIDRIENGYARPAFVLFYAIEQADSFTNAHIINTDEELEAQGVESPSITDYLNCENPNPYDEKYIETENFVLTNAKAKINSCTYLTDGEKTEYITRITEGVNKYLIPAYITLGNSIKTILQTPKYSETFSKNYGGLATLYGDVGKSYYEVLFKDATGTEDSIATASETIMKEYNALVSELDDIRAKLVGKGVSKSEIDNLVIKMFNDDDWSETALYSTIDTLKTTLSDNLPAFAENAGEIKLKIVDESVKDSFAPAAYFVSALDNKSCDEVIVINNWDSTGYLSYDLLSHEGIPGHLYQNNYLKNSDKHDIVKVLCPTSYKEGWATYAEHYVAELYGEYDSVENLLMRYQVKKTLAKGYLRVLADMKVNYDGCDTDAIKTWLQDTIKINDHSYLLNTMDEGDDGKQVAYTMTVAGFANSLTINAIIDPCNAATYYYSYIQVKNIISTLQSSKGYSLYDAHKAYLDSPYTFTLIKEKYGL